MAEVLVLAVLQKIAAAIGEEVVKAGSSWLLKGASDLRNIRSNIIHIQREFTVMQAFLQKADVHINSNQPFDAWLEEVRKVARNVEDIIDEYAYLIEQTKGTSNSVKKTFRYIKKLTSWYEINTQLKQVKDQLGHLAEMRERYGIIISESGSSNNPPNSSSRLDLSTTIVEDEVVGHVRERTKLIQWLLEKDPGRVVISISGMGGLGKTTLVNTIYKKEEIKKNFECCAFVSVSQNFQIEDLLRSIIKQIHEREDKVPSEIDSMDLGDLIARLQCYMQNKSYLVVLDDMWKRDAWLLLSHGFPVNNRGARVVITTRIKEVAILADENHAIELKELSDEESWNLFCKKTFEKLRERICPLHLVDWAKKILAKCQGLPLAIVAIGSLLSFREMTEREWRIFYDQLSWQLSNNLDELGRVANLLNLSYINLPVYLKNCILYCSLFPEDFLIERKQMIRLWIAEGFIEERGMETTLEEVGDIYLVELAHRSLLQVVDRNVNGVAKRFRMHDLVRDICITRSKRESFGIVCDNQHLRSLNEKPRRVFVQSQCESLQLDTCSSKLRSFLLFNNQLPSSRIENALSNFKLMRVLCLKYSRIKSLPNVVFELFNLHYLDLSLTKIKVIPKSLGKLKLVQTLDLRGTLIDQLPREITKLTNLRHLLVQLYHDYQSRIFDWFSGVSVPVEICDLKYLQTLYAIEANEKLVFHLGSLETLTSIFLMKVKGSYIPYIWFSISKMPRLNRLCIIACDKDEVLNFENLDPILFHLEKLYLQGKLEGGVIPSIFNSFGNIIGLRMGWSGLRVDPLSSFSHMSNLADLHLDKVYEGQVLTFRSGWFPKLKNLNLVDLLHLTRINFEEGTTKSLHCLWLVGLRSLKKVPKGIRHLCSLQNMEIEDMPMEFLESLRGEDHNIIRHIPRINVYD